MMNIMVVEDDVMFRHAIRSIIDWEAYGFKITSEAINGRHALNMMEKQLPDIIITDISMPEMNGIDLIKEVRRRYASIKIIVLSSYDDFEFVKDALKSGAEDYLLKYELNNKKGDLIKLLQQTRSSIEQDQIRENESKLIKSNLYAIADDFAMKVLNDEISDISEIEGKIKLLNLRISTAKLVVLLIDIEDIDSDGVITTVQIPPETYQGVKRTIDSFAEERHQGLTVCLPDGKFTVVLSFKDEKSEARIHSSVHDYCTGIAEAIQDNVCTKVSIGVSSLCGNILHLREFYDQAQRALNNRIYDGTGRILYYKPDNAHKAADDKSDIMPLNEIFLAAKDMNYDKSLQELDMLFEILYSRRPDFIDLQKVLLEIFTGIWNICRESKIDFKDVTGTDHIPLESLDNIRSLEKFRKYFICCMNKFFELASAGKPLYRREVQKTIKFIHLNYMKEIPLNQIAAELNISSNYLCNIFKKETGYRIMEYLNKIRVGEAKKLLRDSELKVYEIAEKVGYTNTSYFCTVFKDIEGITVKEYKKGFTS